MVVVPSAKLQRLAEYRLTRARYWCVGASCVAPARQSLFTRFTCFSCFRLVAALEAALVESPGDGLAGLHHVFRGARNQVHALFCKQADDASRRRGNAGKWSDVRMIASGGPSAATRVVNHGELFGAKRRSGADARPGGSAGCR